MFSKTYAARRKKVLSGAIGKQTKKTFNNLVKLRTAHAKKTYKKFASTVQGAKPTKRKVRKAMQILRRDRLAQYSSRH